MLPLLYRFATAFFIQSVLVIRGIHESDENLPYFADNIFGGFIAGSMASASKREHKADRFDSASDQLGSLPDDQTISESDISASLQI
jgi:hypothetical protein